MALRRFSAEGGPRPDRTALLSLGMVVLFAPLAGLCLLPFLLVLGLTGLPLRCGYLLWVLTACLYGLRPVQWTLARMLWPVRRPTQGEQDRLDEVWFPVLRRAAVSERRFRIWVVDLADVNAHCVGRDLICVTSGALAELGDRELAGVLAHELGHHLRMHTAAAAFLVWVLLPLQAVALIGSALALPFARLARGLGRDRTERGFGPRHAALAVLGRLENGLRLLFAAPGMLAFAVKNAASRTSEYQVDAYAVDLGFGAELLSALRWFEACTPPVAAQPLVPGPRRARHAAVREARPTHPPLERRMARITARLALEAAAAVPGQGTGPEGHALSRTLLP